jgi:transposase-like protein
MHPEAREALRISLKLAVLEYAKHVSVAAACREFNVPRSSFYVWKRKYKLEGGCARIRVKLVDSRDASINSALREYKHAHRNQQWDYRSC